MYYRSISINSKPKEILHGIDGRKLDINCKLSNVHACKQGFCFQNTFVAVKDLKQNIILQTPFYLKFSLFM